MTEKKSITLCRHFNITLCDCFVCSVFTTGAGDGELLVAIRDAQNELVPFEMRPTTTGYQIKYTPASTGTCIINVSFGGAQVPG